MDEADRILNMDFEEEVWSGLIYLLCGRLIQLKLITITQTAPIGTDISSYFSSL